MRATEKKRRRVALKAALEEKYGKRGPGRPKFVATPEQRKMVEFMVGRFDLVQIADLVGVSPSMVRKHFPQELKTGEARANLLVVKTGFLQATGGPEQDWEKADAAMTRWWLEVNMGWRRPPDRILQAQLTGSIDYSRLSDEQIAELERLLSLASPADGGGPEGGAGPPAD
jgi:hypothetical protein